MTNSTVHSISELWSAVDAAKEELVKRAHCFQMAKEKAEEPVWYRGHSQSAYGLTPSLFRTANGIENEKTLHQVYRAFKPNLKGWETLFHMQHFFVPTRLLDWTTDLATALYFAVNDDDCHVPSIYVLHPCLLNWEALDHDPEKLLPFYPVEQPGGSSDCPYRYPQDYVPQSRHRRPIALRPGIKNWRIRAQSSVFTIHGVETGPIENLCPACLVKIEIHASANEIRLLRNLGRESRDVFPDETGMSLTLRTRFGLKTIPHSETVIKEAVFRIWEEDYNNFRAGGLDRLHMQGLADCARETDYFERTTIFEVEEWLANGKEPLAIVLGPAASGKTNFLFNLVLKGKRYATRSFLYCRLNDFRPSEHTLGEFLAASLAQMARVGSHPPASIDELTLESMVSEGRIVLILDGLDELVRIQGEECAAHLGTQIRRLTASGATRSRIILGCRDHIVRNLESKVPRLITDAKKIFLDEIPKNRVEVKWGLQPNVAEVVAREPLLCRILPLAPNPQLFVQASDFWNFWLDEAGRKLLSPLSRQELLNQLGAVATLMLKRRDDFLSDDQLRGKPELADLISCLADRSQNPCPLFVREIDRKVRFAHQKIREYVLASNMKYGLDDPDSDNVLTATSALDYESAETYLCLQGLLLDANLDNHIPTRYYRDRTSMESEVRWNNFARNYFEAVGMLGVKNDAERRAAVQQALDAIGAETGARLKTKFNAARCLTRLHPTSPQPYCEHAAKASWPEIDNGSCSVAYGYAVRGFHQTRLKIARRPPEVFRIEPADFESGRTYDADLGVGVSTQLFDQIERIASVEDLRLGERFLQVNCAHALIRWLPGRDETLCKRAYELMEDRRIQREARMNLFLALCVHGKQPANAGAILQKAIDGKACKPKHFSGDLDTLCGPEDDPNDDR